MSFLTRRLHHSSVSSSNGSASVTRAVFAIDGHTRQSTVFSMRSSDAVTSDEPSRPLPAPRESLADQTRRSGNPDVFAGPARERLRIGGERLHRTQVEPRAADLLTSGMLTVTTVAPNRVSSASTSSIAVATSGSTLSVAVSPPERPSRSRGTGSPRPGSMCRHRLSIPRHGRDRSSDVRSHHCVFGG